jgi:DNA mismatch repair protein MutL
MQNFFINGRYIKSRTLTAALEEAYKKRLMIGKFPFCVLNLSIAPSQIDVNVHPTKLEIKFANEKQAFHAIFWATQNALEAEAMTKQPQYTQSAFKPQNLSREETEITNNYMNILQENKGKIELSLSREMTSKNTLNSDEVEYKTTTNGGFVHYATTPSQSTQAPASNAGAAGYPAPNGAAVHTTSPYYVATPTVPTQSPPAPTDISPSLILSQAIAPRTSYRIIGQAFDTYIIVQSGDELIYIDQHAAHERQIYEGLTKNTLLPQLLMIPESVILTKPEIGIMAENLEYFAELGFDIDIFGDNSIIIRQTPIEIPPAELKVRLVEILDKLSSGNKNAKIDRLERALYTVACKAAIKAHKTLDISEMAALVEWTFEQNGIETCPHGRPLTIVMTKYKIEKEFGRV